MRILQVITLSELGGAQSVVINLANKLCENHEVIVAAGEGDGKMFDGLSLKVTTERVPSLMRRLSPINELKAMLQLKKIYRKYHPDIIHLHSSKAGILGRIAFPKSKIVYTVHGFDSIRIAYRKFLPLEKILQYQCAYIVGVSRYDERNLLDEGINQNVSVVYNGIFKPKELDADPFKDFKGYKGKVLCIARLSPQKNTKLFIDVARLLPEYAFIWIGNQSLPNFDYPKNVYFIGNIQGAGSYAKYADVFMLPSNYEGLPMVIIEALTNGTPVVASDVGGISELLDCDNGYALKNEAGIMAEKIKEIITLPTQKKEAMFRHCVSTYENQFTVDKMVNGYLNIYEKIVNR